jgi:alpha-beta hydrolase superfamily lysophospholipase
MGVFPTLRLSRTMTAVAVVGMVCAGATAASAGTSGGGSSTDGGPRSHGHLRAGELLTASPLTTAAALPSAASTQLVTYVSDDAHGTPIVVSGTVSTPKTPAPPGGWPVISWAHGTSGYADVCAPSNDTVDGLDHDYFAVIDPTLDSWVARGYVVVQTDYEGLGTPGPHPYLNGVSEANTVIDIVRAARDLNNRVGRNWVVMGHSQGGQAALFTAQLAAQRAPDLRLRGAVPIAPGGTYVEQTVPYIQSGQPGAAAAEAFLPLILLGAQAADPAINADALVNGAFGPAMTAARTGCLAQLRAVTPIDPTTVFRPGADTSTLNAYLAQQDPLATDPQVPTLIAQGALDQLVAKSATDALVTALCKKGASIDYRVYPGQDHRGSVAASLPDAQAFVDTVLAGGTPPSTC